jgi:hypothetical protein
VTPEASRLFFLVHITSGSFACDNAAQPSSDDAVDGAVASDGEDDVDLDPVAQSEDASDGAGDPPSPATVDMTSMSRPFAITGCFNVSDTAAFAGVGYKYNLSPLCPAGTETVGGGCNLDVGHNDHSWLVSSGRANAVAGPFGWGCSAYHVSGDGSFDIQAFARCCDDSDVACFSPQPNDGNFSGFGEKVVNSPSCPADYFGHATILVSGDCSIVDITSTHEPHSWLADSYKSGNVWRCSANHSSADSDFTLRARPLCCYTP